MLPLSIALILTSGVLDIQFALRGKVNLAAAESSIRSFHFFKEPCFVGPATKGWPNPDRLCSILPFRVHDPETERTTTPVPTRIAHELGGASGVVVRDQRLDRVPDLVLGSARWLVLLGHFLGWLTDGVLVTRRLVTLPDAPYSR
jgi:hypothetical protein